MRTHLLLVRSPPPSSCCPHFLVIHLLLHFFYIAAPSWPRSEASPSFSTVDVSPYGFIDCGQFTYDAFNDTLYMVDITKSVFFEYPSVSSLPLTPSSGTTWPAVIVAGSVVGPASSVEVPPLTATFQTPVGLVGWPWWAYQQRRFALRNQTSELRFVGFFITEYTNQNIRFVNLLRGGNVTLIAGNGSGFSGSTDGVGTQSTMLHPHYASALFSTQTVVLWTESEHYCARQGVPLYNRSLQLQDMVLNVSTFVGLCGASKAAPNPGGLAWKQPIIDGWVASIAVANIVQNQPSTAIVFLAVSSGLRVVSPFNPPESRFLRLLINVTCTQGISVASRRGIVMIFDVFVVSGNDVFNVSTTASLLPNGTALIQRVDNNTFFLGSGPTLRRFGFIPRGPEASMGILTFDGAPTIQFTCCYDAAVSLDPAARWGSLSTSTSASTSVSLPPRYAQLSTINVSHYGFSDMAQFVYDDYSDTLYVASLWNDCLVSYPNVSTLPLTPSTGAKWMAVIVAGSTSGRASAVEVPPLAAQFNATVGVVGWPWWAYQQRRFALRNQTSQRRLIGLFVMEFLNHAVRFVNMLRGGNVTLVAGNGSGLVGATNGVGAQASLDHPHYASASFGSQTTVLWAEVVNRCVRQGIPLYNHSLQLQDMVLNVSTFFGVCGSLLAAPSGGIGWGQPLGAISSIAIANAVHDQPSTAVVFAASSSDLGVLSPFNPPSARYMRFVSSFPSAQGITVVVRRGQSVTFDLFVASAASVVNVSLTGLLFINGTWAFKNAENNTFALVGSGTPRIFGFIPRGPSSSMGVLTMYGGSVLQFTCCFAASMAMDPVADVGSNSVSFSLSSVSVSASVSATAPVTRSISGTSVTAATFTGADAPATPSWSLKPTSTRSWWSKPTSTRSLSSTFSVVTVGTHRTDTATGSTSVTVVRRQTHTNQLLPLSITSSTSLSSGKPSSSGTSSNSVSKAKRIKLPRSASARITRSFTSVVSLSMFTNRPPPATTTLLTASNLTTIIALPSNATQALTAPSTAVPVEYPDSVPATAERQAIAATATTAGATAGMLAGGAAAPLLARAVGTSAMTAVCAQAAVNTTSSLLHQPLSFPLSLLPFLAIGDEASGLQYHRGAVVANTVIVPAAMAILVSGVVLVIGAVLQHRVRSRVIASLATEAGLLPPSQTEKQERGRNRDRLVAASLLTAAVHAASFARHPTILLTVVGLSLDGAVASGVMLAVEGEWGWAVLPGALAIGTLAGCFVVVWVRPVGYVGDAMCHHPLWRRWLVGSGRWVRNGASTFSDQQAEWWHTCCAHFGKYRGPALGGPPPSLPQQALLVASVYFTVMDVAVMVLNALVRGVTLAHPTMCASTSIAVLVLNVLFFILVAIVRPFGAALKNIAAVLSNALLVVASALLVALTFDPTNLALMNAAQKVSTVALIMAVVVAIIVILSKVLPTLHSTYLSITEGRTGGVKRENRDDEFVSHPASIVTTADNVDVVLSVPQPGAPPHPVPPGPSPLDERRRSVDSIEMSEREPSSVVAVSNTAVTSIGDATQLAPLLPDVLPLNPLERRDMRRQRQVSFRLDHNDDSDEPNDPLALLLDDAPTVDVRIASARPQDDDL